MVLQKTKQRVKDLIKHRNAQAQYEFYQRLFDGEKTAALRTLIIPKRAGETDLFADYKAKKTMNADEILSVLQQYDVISFDIFDTLLFRQVPRPTDVFSLVEKSMSTPGFARARIQAEYAARQKMQHLFSTTEVQLQGIYTELMPLYGTRCDEIQRKEIQTEFDCCYANPVMAEFVRKLHDMGKTIITVSDMYLPQEVIVQLLGNCGFTQLERVYVSCEYQVGKADGRLFRIVREQYPKKLIIHIGDNFRSDVLGVKKEKITGLHYLSDKQIVEGKKYGRDTSK